MYLRNKEFVAEIIKSKQEDKLTRAAEKMLVLLANKTIRKMFYADPADRDDCLQTGLEMMFTYWRAFDETKSTNAFAYYTEIFKRGIAKGYRELFYLRGDTENNVRIISMSGSNDGEGMFNM